MPHTYILRCADGSYYVGSTHHLGQRIFEHNSPDLGAMYTRKRRPVVLVWSAAYETIGTAYATEKKIHGWSRAKREALINGEFALLPGLSRRGHLRTNQD